VNRIKQPTHLDDPGYILLFTLEDFSVFMACMALGVITHQLGYFMIGGFLLSYVSGKFRGSLPEGRLQHWMYWHGMPIGKGHSLINPYARRFVG
jgi:conjugal transfer pilus assembly protein TraL